jgi:hypothetical protein
LEIGNPRNRRDGKDKLRNEEAGSGISEIIKIDDMIFLIQLLNATK